MMKPPKMRSIMKHAPKKSEKEKKESRMEESEEYKEDLRPQITFTEQQLPEIKDWNVGKKYSITLEMEQISARTDDYGHNKGKQSASFKITKVGTMPEGTK